MATLAYHIFKKQVSYDGGETWQDTVPLETVKMPVTGVTCEVPWTARVVANLTEYVVSDVCELEQGYANKIHSGCSFVEYENPTEYYFNLCDGDIITSADTTAVNTLFSKAHSQDLAERFSFSKLILKENIKTIDDEAFANDYISDIVFSGTSQLETIGRYAFGFHYIGDANQINPQEYSLEEIGTYTIGSRRTFNMPNSLKNIGNSAFYFYCNVNYFFPDDFVFGANSLIENIGNSAFEKTNGVRIFFNMSTPPSNVSSTIFNGRPGVIIVPNQYLSSYRTALSGLSQYICSTTALGNAGKAEFGDGYDGGVITIPCDSTSSLTFDENSKVYGSYWLKIGDCVDTISGGSKSNLLYLNLGNSLKHIGNNMFSGQTMIDEITLPETLRTIGNSAFTECYRIKNVVIPSGVTSIGEYAFSNCESLRNITVGGGDIGDGAFSFTYSNNATSYDSINILEGVTSIGASAFTNVGLNMFDLTIPDSVTSIGDYAFRDNSIGRCCAITGFTIGSGITSIGDYAFSFDNSIDAYRAVTLRGTSQLETIGRSVFYGTNIIGDLDLPNIRVISAQSFQNCTGLTSVHIGNNVQRIGTYAFSGCTNLTGITIDKTSPDFVTLDWGAFDDTNNCPIYVPCDSYLDYKTSSMWQRYNVRIMPKPECPAIEYKVFGVNRSGNTYSVVCNGDSTLNWSEFQYTAPVTAYIGNCVTNIGNECFYGGADLTSVTISNTVTSIGNSAFTWCTSLTNCTIGSGVTSIGNSAFYGCRSLTSIVIPDNLETIGSAAFRECTRLTSCTLGSGVTSIGDNAFRGCSSLTSITIPNSVTYIWNNTFDGCSSLTGITIPDSVRRIGSAAFRYCSGLTNCTLGSGITEIYDYAFQSCTGLTSIVIPNGVTSIWDYAFSNCYSLTSVTVNAVTPPTLYGDAFDNTNNCPIYVPAGSVNDYKSASGWSSYASRIQAIP